MYVVSASTLAGAYVTGNDAPLTVGLSATLGCSSDLDILSVEWQRDGETIDTAVMGALTISLVTDSHHNTEYTCVVRSPYGSQEISATVAVVGKCLVTAGGHFFSLDIEQHHLGAD